MEDVQIGEKVGIERSGKTVQEKDKILVRELATGEYRYSVEHSNVMLKSNLRHC